VSRASAKELLKALQDGFDRMAEREKDRLTAERDFLKNVLAGSELDSEISTNAFSELYLIDELERLRIS